MTNSVEDHRLQLLKNWLNNTLEHTFSIEPASSDASFRRYFRVEHAGLSYIAMDAPPEHEDIKAFIDIAQRLVEAKVNAPVIHYQDLDAGFLLISDLGKQDYLPNLDADSADQLYQDAIHALHMMQTQITAENLPLYDAALLESEMNLFDTWFLQKHLQINLSSTQQQVLADTKHYLIQSAVQQPQVFVHRDYHSRNLMLTQQNNPGIIDFQDAVIGPITYDLVSLFRDCYISWPDNQVYQWVTDFYQLAKPDVELSTFKQWFDLMGMQRHIKVLGIFARLYHRDNKSGYLKDLPLTYQYTKMIAARYPELSDFHQLLDDVDLDSKLQAVSA